MSFAQPYANPEPSRAEVDRLTGAVLLEFGAPWCGHCRTVQPMLEATLGGRPDVLLIRIEDGRMRRLGRSFGVKLWPTLIFLRDGQERARLVRPASEIEIRDALGNIVSAA